MEASCFNFPSDYDSIVVLSILLMGGVSAMWFTGKFIRYLLKRLWRR